MEFLPEPLICKERKKPLEDKKPGVMNPESKSNDLLVTDNHVLDSPQTL